MMAGDSYNRNAVDENVIVGLARDYVRLDQEHTSLVDERDRLNTAIREVETHRTKCRSQLLAALGVPDEDFEVEGEGTHANPYRLMRTPRDAGEPLNPKETS